MNERTAALASTLLLATGCQTDDDEGPFRITNVEFDDDSTITLTFSEPVADVEGVDPNDFRLNFAITTSSPYTYEGMTVVYEYASYNDVAYILEGYDEYGAPEPFMLMELTPGSAANQLVLRSSESLAPACDAVIGLPESYQMYAPEAAQIDVALFLHYASGEIPIESESGSALADIGRAWAESNDLYFTFERFGFPELTPQLRIPCE